MSEIWRGKPEDDELRKLKKERQYIIFVPNPEDETNFSVMVVDTLSSNSIHEEYQEESFNVSNIIIKGIMNMLDNELDYLVERGESFIMDEYREEKENEFKNSENVIVFDPKKAKH